ncbi:MAG: hypothetical protein IT576_02115 [Verrucomicrobiales bacterium]|nr:hypothetical protein [Verrucomicrobiales bacterium]
MNTARYDLDEIKGRIQLMDLLGRDGIEFRRKGTNMVACCPFHQEKTGSFTVHGTDQHAHCYGCGWRGDVIDYWMSSRSRTKGEAIKELAEMARIEPEEWTPANRKIRMEREPFRRTLPELPNFQPLTDADIETLALLRGFHEGAIRDLAALGLVFKCSWPQFRSKSGEWWESPDAVPSWVVTDPRRAVAQFRMLNGDPFRIRRDNGEFDQIKAWTKGSPSWPVGCAQINRHRHILLVEGGADLIAGYQLIHSFIDQSGPGVAPVAMLGASNRIGPDALPFFKGKQVRIMLDNDPEDPKTGKIASHEAALRWTEQLISAGARVESYSLAGIEMPDGRPLKDTNDLALLGVEAIRELGCDEAFTCWEF